MGVEVLRHHAIPAGITPVLIFLLEIVRYLHHVGVRHRALATTVVVHPQFDEACLCNAQGNALLRDCEHMHHRLHSAYGNPHQGTTCSQGLAAHTGTRTKGPTCSQGLAAMATAQRIREPAPRDHKQLGSCNDGHVTAHRESHSLCFLMNTY